MVTVRVKHGDVLDRKTDVLVLKYAQALHGVDRDAFERIRSPTKADELPPVGHTATFAGPPGIRATEVVFIGVVSIEQFGYADVRWFGHQAVVQTSELRPTELCLTLHGIGFGLDEAEAFRAEVAGVLDALAEQRAGSGLRYVTIVDRDRERVDRLVPVLRKLLQDRTQPWESRLESAGLESDRKRHAFVAMPFSDDHSDHFHYGIRPPITDAGLLCERMDELHFTGDVVAMMEKQIRSADVVVADLTTSNPNVYLEVGYAWAAGRPVILLCRQGAEPHFDVRGHRYLRYTSIRDLEEKLRAELAGLGR